ncbi:MAG: SIS domain-containing protein, partial [Acidobacteriota bacterium]
MTSRPPASDEASPAWSQLGTESQLEASRSLDTLPTDRVVELLLEEDRCGLDAALRRSAEIAVAAEKVAATLEGGGDVIFVGAGTSGRLGVLEAAECPPTFGTDPARIRAAIAGGEDAVFRAKEGAEDRDDAGREIARELGSGDFLIGLSASSVTPYARGALAEARRRGIATLLVTCADGE